MLLRRITEHVKAQNWTAVALDFFIVVVGVFIGIQVANWNDDRQRTANERLYLERLYAEVMILREERGFYDRIRASNAALLVEAVSFIEDETATAALSPAHCYAIADMSYLTAPPTGLPTATELLSAGQLNIIRAPKVRAGILDFYQEADRASDLIAEISRNSVNLSRLYPDYFTIRLVADTSHNDGFDRAVQCDEHAMRENHTFRNQLHDMTFAYQIYNGRGVQKVSKSLHDLHSELEIVLSKAKN
ncbi:hypothetical protein [Hyphococcus sp. DH-69]|uniref:hypothetical protein n=1 Tax=Hyphococcus formosus TaxID=3143534 RepID=UPI00398B3AF4